MNGGDNNLVCPWCDTEIVWDPEIGPENECPHCFNELGSYRSITLRMKPKGEERSVAEDDEAADEDNAPRGGMIARGGSFRGIVPEDGLPDDESIADDGYDEMTTACIDNQEEAPECSYCHELMLLAGVHRMAEGEFAPAVPQPLGKPFLPAAMVRNVYVCPSCFKVETFLADRDRLAMINIFKEGG